MAINDISLTSGMRSNLISLQGTVNLLNRTQERLSSGKKVNSALDNPTAFFAAQGLSGRASDLAGLKDGMGQGIQAIKAADNGIKAISTLIDAAKGIAQSALATTDATALSLLGVQYSNLMVQLDTVVSDSNYVGTNLLNGSSDLVVNFNEDNSSSMTVSSVASKSADLLIDTATVTMTSASTASDINATITALNTAKDTLRTTSASLSAGLSVIQTRQTFTGDMINALSTGADSLVNADMNEEGANMLMLQTRQSLGTTALSLSSQAAQSVLRLFG
ncbi:MAG: flagellin [Thermodesulfovibrionales bacterium]